MKFSQAMRIIPFLLVFAANLLISCGRDSDQVPTPPPIQQVPLEEKNPDSEPTESADQEGSSKGNKPISEDKGKTDDADPSDEVNQINPEDKYDIAYDGIDPVLELLGEESRCSLYIVASSLDQSGQKTYFIRTSFHHDNETHEVFRVQSNDLKSPGLLINSPTGTAQIYLNIGKDLDLTSIQGFNLKWFHINHYDTGRCERLQLRNVAA